MPQQKKVLNYSESTQDEFGHTPARLGLSGDKTLVNTEVLVLGRQREIKSQFFSKPEARKRTPSPFISPSDNTASHTHLQLTALTATIAKTTRIYNRMMTTSLCLRDAARSFSDRAANTANLFANNHVNILSMQNLTFY